MPRGTFGELRSHAFTVSPGYRRALVQTSLPASLRPVREELAGMLLDKISIDNPHLVAIERKMDREIADKRGFSAIRPSGPPQSAPTLLTPPSIQTPKVRTVVRP